MSGATTVAKLGGSGQVRLLHSEIRHLLGESGPDLHQLNSTVQLRLPPTAINYKF